jgi:hypothetical protein
MKTNKNEPNPMEELGQAIMVIMSKYERVILSRNIKRGLAKKEKAVYVRQSCNVNQCKV